MKYREFRDLYRGMGAEEHVVTHAEGYDVASVGKRQKILMPYAFPSHGIILPDGDETILEDEEIAIHLHEIEKLLGKTGGSSC